MKINDKEYTGQEIVGKILGNVIFGVIKWGSIALVFKFVLGI
jgi:hypothetical protein